MVVYYNVLYIKNKRRSPTEYFDENYLSQFPKSILFQSFNHLQPDSCMTFLEITVNIKRFITIKILLSY